MSISEVKVSLLTPYPDLLSDVFGKERVIQHEQSGNTIKFTLTDYQIFLAKYGGIRITYVSD